jgi:hypothetical protein
MSACDNSDNIRNVKKCFDIYFFSCIIVSQSEAIHNKDYSVVKTFKAGQAIVSLLFLLVFTP